MEAEKGMRSKISKRKRKKKFKIVFKEKKNLRTYEIASKVKPIIKKEIKKNVK